MSDVLSTIVQKRKEDYLRLGPTFGCVIPEHRSRPVVPFLAECGTILEVKRASPSKGDIALNLDPIKLVSQYFHAGTKNVSVLTESNFFKGSLNDLTCVSSAYPTLSFLRKDFILYEDEIEISYRSGADAVLLIARILDLPLLLRLAEKIRVFGMTPFIEVRESDDVQKLQRAAKDGYVLSGVNSRDLATFAIDPLVPAALRRELPCRVVFESGASTPGACRFARQLGFEGILIGEAAAKNPEKAHELVSAFVSAKSDWVGQFWREIAERALALKKIKRQNGRPLVKICGITNTEDALAACDLGADLLGFVFAQSPRATTDSVVRSIARDLKARFAPLSKNEKRQPLLIGIITEIESTCAKDAINLVNEGILDAIQFHGDEGPVFSTLESFGGDHGLGRYSVVRVGSEEDIKILQNRLANGEPRVLLDARVEGIAGGTGKTIPKLLLRQLADNGSLWLAGGITSANIRMYVKEFSPELVDVSSGLESSAGKKDISLMKSFFRELSHE